MKLVVLDGYLVGTGGLDWSPLSDFGDFVYYDLTTGALSHHRRNHSCLSQSEAHR